MRVVVVGAGEVGFDVARMLAFEQHDVTVIDIEPGVLQRVREKLDVMTVQGNGTSALVLEQAGIQEADMLVAVTAVDEVNLIACMMADRLGVPTTIARTRSDEIARAHSVLQAKDFGIDLVIHPEESAAVEVTRLIERAAATDVLTFCEGALHLVGMRIDRDAPVLGQTLQEVAAGHPELEFRIQAVVRGVRTLLPRGDERIQPNDQVFVLTRPKDVTPVARVMGKAEARMQHVMVLGGTRVGAGVAMRLGAQGGKRIKLIEPDRERAETLAAQLGDVLVLQGDTTDIDLLVREGLGEMDAVVAVTNDEESNLVTCLMAKHLGVRKTVGLLSKAAYIPFGQTIGLDAAVSKKLAVAREVRRYLRGKHVLSVATVHGLDAEILEIEAVPEAPVTRRPLKDLDLPDGILFGAIQHNGTAEIATGTTHVTAGDRAIVFVLPEQVEAVEALFAAAKGVFGRR